MHVILTSYNYRLDVSKACYLVRYYNIIFGVYQTVTVIQVGLSPISADTYLINSPANKEWDKTSF